MQLKLNDLRLVPPILFCMLLAACATPGGEFVRSDLDYDGISLEHPKALRPGGAAVCVNGGDWWLQIPDKGPKIDVGVFCYDWELKKSGKKADAFAKGRTDSLQSIGKIIEQKKGRDIGDFQCSMSIVDVNPAIFHETIEKRMATTIYWSNEQKRVIMVNFVTAKSDWERYESILPRIISSIKIYAKKDEK